MASPLVSRFRNNVAPRLLEKFGNGGVMSVIRVVDNDPDPLLPPDETVTRIEFNAVARGVSENILNGDPNLVSTDLQVICAAIDYVPSVGERVEINGQDKLTVRVDAIPAAGDPAIYRFFLR